MLFRLKEENKKTSGFPCRTPLAVCCLFNDCLWTYRYTIQQQKYLQNEVCLRTLLLKQKGFWKRMSSVLLDAFYPMSEKQKSLSNAGMSKKLIDNAVL